ncbi:MAG: HdeD family acid-resistance protein [Betaproteobacteria bacterium]|nr:MAG: HdeD family acid-resistance protein [Betaproteobacteria bacterium]
MTDRNIEERRTFRDTASTTPADRAHARCIGLTRNWWALTVRGAAAVLFGIVALFLPGEAIITLALLFSAYLLTDGAFAIVAGVRAARRGERWWSFVLEGAADITAAVITLLWPGLTVVAFVALTAAWAVITGALMLVASRRLTEQLGRWMLVLAGVLSLLWGVMLIAAPFAGAIVLTWWMGAYALLFGATLIGLSVRLRSRRRASGGVPLVV